MRLRMKVMNKQRLVEQLERHEGLKLHPYKCTAGKTTIGIGRNLIDKGISPEEARVMLNNDINEFKREIESKLPIYNALDDARQNVILNMAFNLGVNGLLTFRNMINCISLQDYSGAANEMLNSKWAKQVGKRANELAEQMLTGEFK